MRHSLACPLKKKYKKVPQYAITVKTASATSRGGWEFIRYLRWFQKRNGEKSRRMRKEKKKKKKGKGQRKRYG